MYKKYKEIAIIISALLIIQCLPVMASENKSWQKNEVEACEDVSLTSPVEPVRAARAYVSMLGNGSDSYYDAREDGIVTAVKSQKHGDCYNYAMTSLAETSMLKNGIGSFTADTLDLSEEVSFRELFESSPDPLGLLGTDHAVGNAQSGYVVQGMLYEFATNSCPVTSDDAEPYYDTAATLKEGYAELASDLTVSEIKERIKKYGAVAIHKPASSDTRRTHFYYSETTLGSAYAVAQNLGHAVAVVGWDDSIPAEDFLNEYGEQPSSDGGWLCKDSGGVEHGDNGYFWLSYEDASLTYSSNNRLSSYVTYLAMEEPRNWNIYQYDGGASDLFAYVYYAANVFEAKGNLEGTELLRRVGVFARGGSYTVDVYKYTSSNLAPWEQGTLLGTASLEIPPCFVGYKTVVFENPIPLSYGDKFSVCIKRTDGGSFGIGTDCVDAYNIVSAHAGESFIQSVNSSAPWEDASSSQYVRSTDGNGNVRIGGNVRIKAFTLCNEDGAHSPRTVGSVTVSENFTYTGAEIKPSVTIKDTDGNILDRHDCTITYSNNINAGTATVTATGKSGGVSGSASATFTIAPKDMSAAVVTPASSSIPYTGSEIRPSATVLLGGKQLTADTDFTLSYENNINSGQATVKATGTGNYTGTATANFLITALPGTNATIDCTSVCEYTGSQITPEVSVKYNNKPLSLGTDYTVSYGSNILYGAGTVIVNFMGNYYGSVTKYFTIAEKDGTKCTVSYNMTNDYTGEAVTPGITVYDGTYQLRKGTDYDVSYANNIDIGDTAEIRIAYKGQYGGTAKKYFSIVPIGIANLTFGSVPDDEGRCYTGSEITPFVPEVSSAWVLSEGTDYDVSFRDNVNAGTGYVVYTFKGAYYGTKEIPFTIYPVSLENAVISDIPDMNYTAKPVEPSAKVKAEGVVLTENADYTLSYKNNVDAGQATAVVSGNGNYSGTKETFFTIRPVDISSATAEDIPVQKYTGAEITPKVTVSLNGVSLTENRDYVLSYSDNVDEGTATVTITGTGNLTGTKTAQFEISRSAITDTDDPEKKDSGNGDKEDSKPSDSKDNGKDNKSGKENDGNHSDDGGNDSGNTPDTPDHPDNADNGSGKETVDDNGGNISTDPTEEADNGADKDEKTTITATGNNLTAVITMEKKVPFSRNKKILTENAHITLSSVGGISIKSVKASVPVNGQASVTIKLKGSSKDEKKAVKEMNRSLKKLSVEVEKVDLSKASVSVALSPKGDRVKKVTVDGEKLKKSDYSSSITNGTVIITGKGNYTGTYGKVI